MNDRRLRIGGALAAVATFAACATVPPPRPVALDPLLPAVQARVDHSQSFAMLANLVRQQATFVARGDVERYVDEVHAALLAGPVDDTALLVASLLPGDGAAWVAFVQDRRERPELHRRLETARRETAAALVRGDLAAAMAAAETALQEASPGIAHGVAATWHAFVVAASDEPGARRTSFDAAARELAPASPILAAQVLLLSHAIDTDAATWTAAVDRLAAATAANPRVAMPATWQRAAATRPEAGRWPSNVDAAMRGVVGPDAGAFAASLDDLLTYAVAQMQLRRGDALAALVAFRSLERPDLAPSARGLAEVGQAKALVAMGRSGDARAVLATTVTSSDPTAVAAGLAQLGAIELAENRPAVALALLQKAAASPATAWSDRGGALGNLAAALAANGTPDHERWEAAYRALLAAGDFDGVLLCLENTIALCSESAPRIAEAAQRRYDALRATGRPDAD